MNTLSPIYKFMIRQALKKVPKESIQKLKNIDKNIPKNIDKNNFKHKKNKIK